MDKLKMSFYDGTMDRKKLTDFIEKTNKEVRYTRGLEYRKPRVCRQPITKEEALEIVKSDSWLDANEYDEFLLLNTFSENDMW